eukprot:scaffold103366_cov22-Prasinocladus_malaysianus.AAC.1
MSLSLHHNSNAHNPACYRPGRIACESRTVEKPALSAGAERGGRPRHPPRGHPHRKATRVHPRDDLRAQHPDAAVRGEAAPLGEDGADQQLVDGAVPGGGAGGGEAQPHLQGEGVPAGGARPQAGGPQVLPVVV